MLETVSLNQLRMLIAIDEAGSFSAAARRVHRAQSAVSHAIQTLETALGVVLFDRAGRVPRLTDAGHVILADARAVVSRADELKARAASIAERVEPELSLAVDAMFPRPVLTESLRALQSAFPLLAATLHTEVLGAVEARVLDGSCRLGIAPHWSAEPVARLDWRYLTHITLVSVVAANHPLADHPGPISRRALERHTQLVLTDRSGRSGAMMRGVISQRVWRFADVAMRHAFVLDGFGFCNIPIDLVRDDLAAGRLKRISVEGWGGPAYRIPLSFIYRRGDEPGRAARWLIEHMKRRFEPEPGHDAEGARPHDPSWS
jgi:DNA-binding transcriptional LysR family regulator